MLMLVEVVEKCLTTNNHIECVFPEFLLLVDANENYTHSAATRSLAVNRGMGKRMMCGGTCSYIFRHRLAYTDRLV